MTDIVERLRKLAAIDNCQASIEAADEIERLRAALVKVRVQMKWLAENEPDCLGEVLMDDGSDVPAICIAVSGIDAALEGK